jgi:hypothetical protein
MVRTVSHFILMSSCVSANFVAYRTTAFERGRNACFIHANGLCVVVPIASFTAAAFATLLSLYDSDRGGCSLVPCDSISQRFNGQCERVYGIFKHLANTLRKFRSCFLGCTSHLFAVLYGLRRACEFRGLFERRSVNPP